jgi:ribosomal protein S6
MAAGRDVVLSPATSCHGKTVQELDRQLNLNEGVLRTKVLRPEHR